ncbi:hypothetical protein HELRODRAFT_178922 [Helobdella robusta]|uniref:Corticotropin-releasing factor domain-containing protein n=1 Tax=Helobdella robusta TaxID=6412 RepID=T1FDW5_HELRO|nr:hypothetical protein HELRODRAFT_178922 [Helobdella robusta]ESN96002.1 hypothetical protein HELRODRAFT_178922 [Helobdella robusta]
MFLKYLLLLILFFSFDNSSIIASSILPPHQQHLRTSNAVYYEHNNDGGGDNNSNNYSNNNNYYDLEQESMEIKSQPGHTFSELSNRIGHRTKLAFLNDHLIRRARSGNEKRKNNWAQGNMAVWG